MNYILKHNSDLNVTPRVSPTSIRNKKKNKEFPHAARSQSVIEIRADEGKEKNKFADMRHNSMASFDSQRIAHKKRL